MKFYKMCAVKEVGVDFGKAALVKTDAWVNSGDLVTFRANDVLHVAEVIHISYVSEGSSEEDVLKAVAPVYEAEKIYSQSWEKEEEEQNDVN